MPLCRTGRRLLSAVVATALLLTLPAPAWAAEGHRRPVDGAVADGWRPPDGPYGAGNRGIDLHTVVGAPVVASAAGEVSFAGPVGGTLHVVVTHPDGLRTSYSFLRTVAVASGQLVEGGEVLGTTGERVHLGARAGDRYVDPSLLWDQLATGAHLIPVAPGPTGTGGGRPDDEAVWLRALAKRPAGWDEATTRWARGDGPAADGLPSSAVRLLIAGAAAVVSAPGALTTASMLASSAAVGSAGAAARLRVQLAGAAAFERSQEGCTPAGEAVPERPAEPRIVVLVAGFGSTSEGSGILDVDTAALGYGHEEVVQFSYRGGRVEGIGDLDGVPASAYGRAESTGDLSVAARRFRELLEAIGRARPGVPVDILAHSQGGVVARAALAGSDAASLPVVANLVTLGSPHNGVGLAATGAALAATAFGRLVEPATAAAVPQLAEGSAFLRSLAGSPLPPGVRTTSIAARGDLVVPALHSTLRGAGHAVVALDGPSAHSSLPGSASAQREIGLALAGAGPTCRAIAADLALAATISLAAGRLGTALGSAVRTLDPGIPSEGGRRVARRPPAGSRVFAPSGRR